MRQATRSWLRTLTPPVAVFIERPVVARIAATICGELGLHIPQDVAILCGIDDPIICEQTTPGLTCTDHNFSTAGYEAAALLDRIMKGKPAPKKPVLIPPAGVIQRASTDFFAVENKLVAEAVRFIADNIHRPINAQDVVEAMAVSRSTLKLAFRDHMGTAISSEIARLRIEKVKRLLLDSERHTLQTIAARSGLRSAKELCRIFRREVGRTPGQYRKEVLGKRL